MTNRLTEGWKHPETIDDVPEGTEAWCWSTGALRRVVVLSAARTRVTVGFEQKNGVVREKVVRFDALLVPDRTAPRRLVAPAWIRSHRDRRTLVVGTEDVRAWIAAPYVWTTHESGRRVIDHEATAAANAALLDQQLDLVERARPGLWLTPPARRRRNPEHEAELAKLVAAWDELGRRITALEEAPYPAEGTADLWVIQQHVDAAIVAIPNAIARCEARS